MNYQNKEASNLKNIKREITFFYDEAVEKVHWGHVKLEAIQRGYSTCFSKNMDQKAEIGFYCSDNNKPENSKLSFVMLHGMDQGRTRWPNIWRDWPWNKFDIGLLPGKTWSERWKNSAFDPYAHPKIAVCEVGSPKADEIFANKYLFQEKVDEIARELNLPFDKTVLYAPSFETDNKQKDIIDLLQSTKTNILIKHWLISDDDKKSFPDVWTNIQNACKDISDHQTHIRILSPEMSIMTCLGLCDVLVTDESSVAYEALLLNREVFTLKNWMMRTNNVDEPRPVDPPSDIVNKVDREELKEFMTKYNKKAGVSGMNTKRDDVFSHLGSSSEKIIDIVDAALIGDEFQNIVVSNKKVKKWLIPIRFIAKTVSSILTETLKIQIRNFLIHKKFMGSYFGKSS